MIDPTNASWILATTYDYNLHRFLLKDPLEFVYSDGTVWVFKNSELIVDRSGAGVGTWEIAPNQPQNNHLIVDIKTDAGGSSIEFLNDDFGVFYSAGQIVYFLAREHAFHPEW